jgi:glycerol uptake facilitator-like aquaporin
MPISSTFFRRRYFQKFITSVPVCSRLLTLIAGWSLEDTFVTEDGVPYFFWIPLILPHVGGVVGALIYTGLGSIL